MEIEPAVRVESKNGLHSVIFPTSNYCSNQGNRAMGTWLNANHFYFSYISMKVREKVLSPHHSMGNVLSPSKGAKRRFSF